MNRLIKIIGDLMFFLITSFCFYTGWNVFFVEVLNLSKITYWQSIAFLCCCMPIRYALSTTNENLTKIIELKENKNDK